MISVDIPSGLPSDQILEGTLAVIADETVIRECPKLGAFLFPKRDYYGKLTTVLIGIPNNVVEQMAKTRFLWTKEQAQSTVPKRSRNTHKGIFGKASYLVAHMK